MESSDMASQGTSMIGNVLAKTKEFLMTKWKMILLVAVLVVVGYVAYTKYFKNAAAPSGERPSVEGFDDGSSTLRIFHVDWCPHCKDAVPEFEKLAESNKTVKGKEVEYVKVNPEETEQNKELASKFGVDGYPTIILTTGGKDITFQGERTAEGMKQFLESNL